MRHSIGIALEGGGALGIAHVGVLLWMQEHHVPIDRIAGTSMGALARGALAAGLSPEDINGLVAHGELDDLFTTRPSLRRLGLRRRQDREDLPQAISFGLRSGVVFLGNALITDNQLNAFLARQLLSYNTDALSFDDLTIPFAAFQLTSQR